MLQKNHRTYVYLQSNATQGTIDHFMHQMFTKMLDCDVYYSTYSSELATKFKHKGYANDNADFLQSQLHFYWDIYNAISDYDFVVIQARSNKLWNAYMSTYTGLTDFIVHNVDELFEFADCIKRVYDSVYHVNCTNSVNVLHEGFDTWMTFAHIIACKYKRKPFIILYDSVQYVTYYECTFEYLTYEFTEWNRRFFPICQAYAYKYARFADNYDTDIYFPVLKHERVIGGNRLSELTLRCKRKVYDALLSNFGNVVIEELEDINDIYDSSCKAKVTLIGHSIVSMPSEMKHQCIALLNGSIPVLHSNLTAHPYYELKHCIDYHEQCFFDTLSKYKKVNIESWIAKYIKLWNQIR